MSSRKLILGSSSPFRRELLQRLKIPFESLSPDIDETPREKESPDELVLRLGREKAQAIARQIEYDAVVIASDQVAVCEGVILGKPGTHENAVAQLERISGKHVSFRTSLCVLDTVAEEIQIDLVPFDVVFRTLTREMIERYLDREPAYNCAGAFKSEGYGITLCERFEGNDPTALIGLPLIRLTRMLEYAGFEIV